jgi:orotidine-5'-phosphate decarboxylase
MVLAVKELMFGHQGRPKTAKDRLVFALDVDSLDEAERLVDLLVDDVGMFKVGPRLFTSAGTAVTEMILAAGSRLFLDLKFHDIPATVAGAAWEAARQRASLFTVHALGGRTMIQEAVRALAQMTVIPGHPLPMCLAVTILTSHDQNEFSELGFVGTLEDQVVRLAHMAVASGAGGIVASGHEIRRLKQVLPEGIVFVTPGIRSPDDASQDQSRVMTPQEAIAAGATYLVAGRPIRLAENPREVAKRFVEAIDAASA